MSCSDVLSSAPLKCSINRSLLSFFAASSLVSISTQTLLYSSRFSFAKILNAGHGLLVSRQQKSFRTSDAVISESSRRLMREICPQGMSKEDCNEGVGETGGSAWSLDWSCCWMLLCWFTGCLSFVPVGVLGFRKKALEVQMFILAFQANSVLVLC